MLSDSYMSSITTNVLSGIAILVSLYSLHKTSNLTEEQIDLGNLNLIPSVSIDERYELPIQTNDSEEQLTTVSWNIENSGLGPALVEQAVVELKGVKYSMDTKEAWHSITNELTTRYKTPIIGYNTDPISCPYSIQDGDDWSLFSVSLKGEIEGSKLEENEVHIAVCYCSLSGDCYYEGTKEGLLTCPVKVSAEGLLRGETCGGNS